TPRSGQDLVLHLVLRPHPGSQDVLPAPPRLLQRRQRLLADHAPVGHDADPADPEPAAEAVDDRDQRRHVGGVARPQFAADRPPLAVEHRPDDHLVEVGPVVLAEPSLADLLAALARDVDRGCFEDDQLQAAEEVPPVAEHARLDPVLAAPGCERRLVLLLAFWQLLAEPGHGPVEVMELEVVATLDLVAVPPPVGGPVAAGGEEAM